MGWTWVAAMLFASTVMARAEVVEELVHLPSAGDARLPVLLSRDDARTPTAAAVLFNGGGGEEPRSEPCEAFSARGFLGVEPPVVDAIVRWMRGEAPPRDVP